MGNRSVRPSLRKRIQDGLIVSVEELKAAFKAEAKRTHPDLAGADAAEAFLRLRRDYEAALRTLAKSSPAASDRTSAAAPPEGAYGAPFATLDLLLKRGFPKRPRHDKERLRYAYARIRARAALHVLGEGAERLFDDAEEELLGLKEKDDRDFRATVILLTDIVAAKLDGNESLIAAVRMELGRRSAATALGAPAARPAEDRPLGKASAAFLRLLVES
jgi:hypothetical protein